MTTTKAKPKVTNVTHPSQERPQLKALGGSQSDAWNNILANQTIQSLWLTHSNEDDRDKQFKATAAALIGIAPKDEIEGMLAAQLIAAHNAAMECYRRAMLAEQTFEGRRENLSQANKLSRSCAVLVEALNRHRGKGQQKVTVEHVTVNAGGQAIVGSVQPPGGGAPSQTEERPHAIPMHRAPQCGARTRSASSCRAPAMRNGRCRLHGGKSTGPPKGNKNAFKHGRYTAQAITRRREVRALLKSIKRLVESS